ERRHDALVRVEARVVVAHVGDDARHVDEVRHSVITSKLGRAVPNDARFSCSSVTSRCRRKNGTTAGSPKMLVRSVAFVSPWYSCTGFVAGSTRVSTGTRSGCSCTPWPAASCSPPGCSVHVSDGQSIERVTPAGVRTRRDVLPFESVTRASITSHQSDAAGVVVDPEWNVPATFTATRPPT